MKSFASTIFITLSILGSFPAQAEDLRAQTNKIIVHVDTVTGEAKFISRKYDVTVANKADDFKQLFQIGNQIYIVNRAGKFFLLADDLEMSTQGRITRRVKAAFAGLTLAGASWLAGNGWLDTATLSAVGMLTVRFNVPTTPYYGMFLTQVSHVRGPEGQNDSITKFDVVEDRVLNPVIKLTAAEKVYDLADFNDQACDFKLGSPYSEDIKKVDIK